MLSLLLLTTQTIAYTETYSINRRILLAGILFEPTVTRETKLDIARSLSTNAFYARFPYSKAEDTLAYLESVADKEPSSVILALDLWSERYPMFQVGPIKGKILEDAVSSSRPIIAVELGSFLGYSAVRIARNLPKNGHLVCVEASPEFAEVAQRVVSYAGFADKVDFIVSRASDCLESLRNAIDGKKIDLLFLDHAKERYFPDLVLLEEAGLIAPGTLVIADNVLYPGAPGYLEHVQSPLYNTKPIPCPYESVGWETKWKVVDDAVAISTKL